MDKQKIFGLVLLAIAIFMLLYGLVDAEVVDAFQIYWMATVAAAIPGILLFMNRPKAATAFARIIVGSIFIVSGLIKANDTVGFGIKLEEYFDENALGSFWALFHDFALPLAIVIAGIEVLLGLAVVFGAKAKLVSIVLLAMTLFFGWLTYYTAGCNAAQMAAISSGAEFNRVCVTDCGCFGDALRGSVGRSLTPWESFYKDLGLLFLTLVIVLRSRHIKVNRRIDDFIILPAAFVVILVFGGWLFGWGFPITFFLVSCIVYFVLKYFKLSERKYEWVLAAVFAVITYGFAIYTYRHLPIKDYRPYAIGKNIKDQMKSAEELGLKATEYANVYRLKNETTGDEKTMNSKEYLEQKLWEAKAWKIIYTSSEPVVISSGYEPPITSFSVMNTDDIDIGEELLNHEGYSFMIVMYDVDKAQEGNAISKLKDLAKEAERQNMPLYAVTSSPYDSYEAYRHAHQLTFPFYTGDEIFLKTIVRSNPGLLLLNNGNIVGKWNGRHIPTFKTLQNKYFS